MSIKVGDKMPAGSFGVMTDAGPGQMSTDELFSGKKVVLLSVPGAFTPTCSSSHVPRFNQLAPAFKAQGVDEIVCMSVNDAFVMNEWKETQNAENITFIPDGNGEFTDGMGLLVAKEDLGFGNRSWRYSMLVRDGVIEKMFIEPEKPGDPFEVSDADTMFSYLAPSESKPLDVTVFARPGCPHCARAKAALGNAGIDFEALELNRDYSDRSLRAVSGSTTVPQVFVNGKLIGGADDLDKWLNTDQSKAA